MQQIPSSCGKSGALALKQKYIIMNGDTETDYRRSSLWMKPIEAAAQATGAMSSCWLEAGFRMCADIGT